MHDSVDIANLSAKLLDPQALTPCSGGVAAPLIARQLDRLLVEVIAQLRSAGNVTILPPFVTDVSYPPRADCEANRAIEKGPGDSRVVFRASLGFYDGEQLGVSRPPLCCEAGPLLPDPRYRGRRLAPHVEATANRCHSPGTPLSW